MGAWWMDSWMCVLCTAAVGCHLLEPACCSPGGSGILEPRHGLPPLCYLTQDHKEEACSLFIPCHSSALMCLLDVTFPILYFFVPHWVGWTPCCDIHASARALTSDGGGGGG